MRDPRSFRPSFRQLLVLAFMLLALLMAGVALRGVFTLERLLLQSREATAQALALNSQLERLTEHRVTMERAARQSLVLGDVALRRIHESAAEEAQEVLQSLVAATGRPEPALAWAERLETVSDELRGPPGPLAARDARLATAFEAMATAQATLATQVQALTEARNAALQAELEGGRAALARQVGAAVVVSLGLALALALALARPLRRVEQAIAALGENRLDTPIEIRGPSDVRALGRRLDWLRQRLATLDADKARFLRHVSHELKTPLASLREGVALLGDGVAGPLSDSQREIARILADNTDALQRRIEDLLRFNAAAFAAQRAVRRPTALAALARAQCEAHALPARAKGVQLLLDGPPLQVQADPELLGTALGNLIGNAVRYSPVDGVVTVRWWALDEDLSIEVQDQGPGVDAEDRERLFEPFYRGRRQPEGGLPGTGIGLAIVAETVAAHGGQVRLIPPPDGPAPATRGAAVAGTPAGASSSALPHPGACFRIDLPHALAL